MNAEDVDAFEKSSTSNFFYINYKMQNFHFWDSSYLKDLNCVLDS